MKGEREVRLALAVTLTAGILGGCKNTPEPTQVVRTPTAIALASPEPTPTATSSPTVEPTSTPKPSATTVFKATAEALSTPTSITDIENQRKLERALGGETIELQSPNITSLWQFPWPAEKGKPQVSYLALLWGENYPAGVITSAGCLREYYEKEGGLGKSVVSVPLTSFRIWKPSPEVRVESLKVKISNYTSLADAETVSYQANNEIQTVECEETKELDRLQKALSNIDWRSLPGKAGELTGEVLAKIAIGIWQGIQKVRSTPIP